MKTMHWKYAALLSLGALLGGCFSHGAYMREHAFSQYGAFDNRTHTFGINMYLGHAGVRWNEDRALLAAKKVCFDAGYSPDDAIVVQKAHTENNFVTQRYKCTGKPPN